MLDEADFVCGTAMQNDVGEHRIRILCGDLPNSHAAVAVGLKGEFIRGSPFYHRITDVAHPRTGEPLTYKMYPAFVWPLLNCKDCVRRATPLDELRDWLAATEGPLYLDVIDEDLVRILVVRDEDFGGHSLGKVKMKQTTQDRCVRGHCFCQLGSDMYDYM